MGTIMLLALDRSRAERSCSMRALTNFSVSQRWQYLVFKDFAGNLLCRHRPERKQVLC